MWKLRPEWLGYRISAAILARGIYKPLLCASPLVADTTLGKQKATSWGQGENRLALLECLEARAVPIPPVSPTAPRSPSGTGRVGKVDWKPPARTGPQGRQRPPGQGGHGQRCWEDWLTRTVGCRPPWVGGQLGNALGEVEANFASHSSVGATETSHQSLAWRLTQARWSGRRGPGVHFQPHARPWGWCPCMASKPPLSCCGQGQPQPLACPVVPAPQVGGVLADLASGAGVPLSLLLALAKCWWTWHAFQHGPWPAV